jgi:hypothetical protein
MHLKNLVSNNIKHFNNKKINRYFYIYLKKEKLNSPKRLKKLFFFSSI